MRPVFLNSAVVRAPERLVLRGGGWTMLDIAVRFALWRHPGRGWVLVDTGYTSRVTSGPRRGLALKLYGGLLRPRLLAGNPALAALAARGVAPGGLHAVVVTHFHGDHVAGLRDYPGVPIIASGAAWNAVAAMKARQRLHHAVFAELFPDDFARRLRPIEDSPLMDVPGALGEGFDLFGDGLCLAVPLPGHAVGHFGLLWPKLDPPLLYAVDTQWLWAAIAERRPPAGPARLIYADEAAALASLERVRAFAQAGGAVVLAHEPSDRDSRGIALA